MRWVTAAESQWSAVIAYNPTVPAASSRLAAESTVPVGVPLLSGTSFPRRVHLPPFALSFRLVDPLASGSPPAGTPAVVPRTIQPSSCAVVRAIDLVLSSFTRTLRYTSGVPVPECTDEFGLL
jgi:hypothetical protein